MSRRDSKRRVSKLARLVSLANSEERRWGRKAGQSRARLDEHIARLNELRGFREDYANKAAATQAIESAHLKDYQSFLLRLDGAVQSQRQIIHEAEQNYEIVRRRWLGKRQRLESLQRVLEKSRQAVAVHRDRAEQKQLDELPFHGGFLSQES